MLLLGHAKAVNSNVNQTKQTHLLSDRWQPAGTLYLFHYICRYYSTKLVAFHQTQSQAGMFTRLWRRQRRPGPVLLQLLRAVGDSACELVHRDVNPVFLVSCG